MTVHDATRRSLDALRNAGNLPESLEVLAAFTLVLAESLDEGAGLATAAVARELRATFDTLSKADYGDDDNGVAAFRAELSAAVGNATQP